MMKKIFQLFIFLFAIVCFGQKPSINSLLSHYNSHRVPYTSVEVLQTKQEKDEVLLIDAREKEEFLVSHLPKAKYVGYSEFDIEDFIRGYKDRSKPIVVYCSLGIRSENIAEKLLDAGYENVTNLYGGIFEWKNKGYPVYADGKETEKVHAYSRKWSVYLINADKIY
jgi:rhodanese-related sulfurtransferase